MFLDAQNEFSDGQAVTVTAVGTNVYDLSLDRSIGNGEPMAVLFTVDVAADQTSSDEDYTFQVEYASNAAQTTGRQLMGERIFESGTPTAPAQDADLLVVGFRIIIPIPPTTLDESEGFIGIRYVTAGSSPTITCSAYLQPMSMITSTNDYASGYDIT
ncbi:MAG: hypothetical protein V3W52_17305 [Syntrophobacteria bacterium]